MSSIDLKTLKAVLNADGPVVTANPDRFESAIRAMADAYGGELGSPVFFSWADYVWFECDEGVVVFKAGDDGSGKDVADRMSYPVEALTPGRMIELALEAESGVEL